MLKLEPNLYLYIIAGVAQLVERQPSKLNVAGSNPVSRSNFCRCSSGVERFLGKEEVTSSNLVIGSSLISFFKNNLINWPNFGHTQFNSLTFL